jgi:YopX protein
MREIKFRAWDTEKKKWMQNWLLDDLGNFYDCGRDLEDGLPTIGRDLMQFTGLRDKNWKEIWEGDIVEIEDGPNKKKRDVIWHKNTASFALKIGNGATEYMPNYVLYGQIEIIGNIYENPESLKAG